MVEGIDYSPEGIEWVRTQLAEMRGQTFQDWPSGINATLVLTYAIALLAHLVAILEEPTEVYQAYLYRKYPEVAAADAILQDLGENGD